MAILLSTHNIGFYGELTKIVLKLSSNTHLIYSSGQLIVLNAHIVVSIGVFYPFAVEIGCNNGSSFLCGDAKCVPRSRVCDGTPDCVSGEDENQCMVPETCQQWWSVGYQTSGIYKVCMYQKIITIFSLFSAPAPISTPQGHF